MKPNIEVRRKRGVAGSGDYGVYVDGRPYTSVWRLRRNSKCRWAVNVPSDFLSDYGLQYVDCGTLDGVRSLVATWLVAERNAMATKRRLDTAHHLLRRAVLPGLTCGAAESLAWSIFAELSDVC